MKIKDAPPQEEAPDLKLLNMKEGEEVFVERRHIVHARMQANRANATAKRRRWKAATQRDESGQIVGYIIRCLHNYTRKQRKGPKWRMRMDREDLDPFRKRLWKLPVGQGIVVPPDKVSTAATFISQAKAAHRQYVWRSHDYRRDPRTGRMAARVRCVYRVY